MIKAIIFDMDGLLIDSEPLWEIAEMKTFSSLGVPLTSEMTKQTMGLRADEVVEYWFTRYPWKKLSKKEVEVLIVNDVINLVKEKGLPKSGVHQIIKLFAEKKLPTAIASSSQTKIIDTVIEKLGIGNTMKVICSAEHEPYGKPHPGVYLTTAKKLGVLPEDCLVFEDSPNGVKAAKAAGMKCIAVPDSKMIKDENFTLADLILTSLSDFDEKMLLL